MPRESPGAEGIGPKQIVVERAPRPLEKEIETGKFMTKYFFKSSKNPLHPTLLAVIRLILSLGFSPVFSTGYNMICTYANNLLGRVVFHDTRADFSPTVGDNHILHMFAETVFEALFTFLGEK